MKIGDVSSSKGFWAAGKQFFRRNPGGFQGKIAPSRGQKTRRLGMLTFFKQALTVLKTGVEVFQRNLDAILKEVSEFELLIDKDGKPHIIDMAGEDPTAKASKDEAQIVEGLKNLLQAIETNLKELNTSQDKPR